MVYSNTAPTTPSSDVVRWRPSTACGCGCIDSHNRRACEEIDGWIVVFRGERGACVQRKCPNMFDFSKRSNTNLGLVQFRVKESQAFTACVEARSGSRHPWSRSRSRSRKQEQE